MKGNAVAKVVGCRTLKREILVSIHILEDFENASLYIGYHLLKNFLKVKRMYMYKIIIVSGTSTR